MAGTPGGNPLMKVLLAIVFAPQVIQSITSLYPPFAVAQARKAYKDRPVLLPDASSMIRMVQTGSLSDGDFERLMQESGYDVNLAHAMRRGAQTYLSALDYISAARRGIMDVGEADQKLLEMGFQQDDLTRLYAVTTYVPTPDDLIRFAVRDIYDDAARSSQNLDAEFPGDFAEQAAKAGMDEQTARNFWASHWNLPAPGQVFEMRHRKLIGEGEVQNYLRAADYAPPWRNLLAGIQFRLLDRVDLRRMYSLGIIGEAELQNRYEMDGYTPEDAALLVRFTVAQSKHTEENTPKANIVGSFKAGVIDRAEASARLEAAGYSPQDATITLDTAESQNKQELINLQADGILDNYVKGLITLDDVKVQLTVLGVPASQLNLTVQRELAQARKRLKNASKSDLDSWYTLGLINDDVYMRRLEALGYSASDVALYDAEIKLSIIKGADAKIPWSFLLRAVAEGKVTEVDALTQLEAVGYDADTQDMFRSILDVITRQ